MPELKTKQNKKSVKEFLNSIQPEQKKEDSFVILKMMEEITKSKPKMWGESIIGFGSEPYTRADGSEHEWFKLGFSPRKQNLTLYILNYYSDDPKQDELLKELGKYKTGKSCLYINKLEDVDTKVLKKLITNSAKS